MSSLGLLVSNRRPALPARSPAVTRGHAYRLTDHPHREGEVHPLQNIQACTDEMHASRQTADCGDHFAKAGMQKRVRSGKGRGSWKEGNEGKRDRREGGENGIGREEGKRRGRESQGGRCDCLIRC